MEAFVFGLFGLLVGSFLNVLVLRHATGLSVIGTKGGGSRCLSCGTYLLWYENIPLISWFLLRGRCRTCKSSISVQYPLVEALTGVLFFTIASAPFLSVLQIGLYSTISALLVAIAVYDVLHTIIPDSWVYTFNALALCITLLTLFAVPGVSIILFLLAGPFAALPLFLLWAVSRGAWMGFGDVKLALGIGWLLGPVLGPLAVMYAFMIGAIVSIGVLLPLPYIMRAFRSWGILRAYGGASYTMKSEVAFGPFLIASTFGTLFLDLYHVPILNLWYF